MAQRIANLVSLVIVFFFSQDDPSSATLRNTKETTRMFGSTCEEWRQRAVGQAELNKEGKFLPSEEGWPIFFFSFLSGLSFLSSLFIEFADLSGSWYPLKIVRSRCF